MKLLAARILAARLLSAFHTVYAADPDPLQDFCIADLAAGPVSNGFPCKLPALATAEDFAYSGLAKPADPSLSSTGGVGTLAFVKEWPALNTQGLSLLRLDINPSAIAWRDVYGLRHQ
ncbi:protein MpCupin82 [Marchantia polymorpha subsp. ruderalis]